jgi:hypothetical protein
MTLNVIWKRGQRLRLTEPPFGSVATIDQRCICDLGAMSPFDAVDGCQLLQRNRVGSYVAAVELT